MNHSFKETLELEYSKLNSWFPICMMSDLCVRATFHSGSWIIMTEQIKDFSHI